MDEIRQLVDDVKAKVSRVSGFKRASVLLGVWALCCVWCVLTFAPTILQGQSRCASCGGDGCTSCDVLISALSCFFPSTPLFPRHTPLTTLSHMQTPLMLHRVATLLSCW